MIDAANFVWVVVASLFFTSVTCVGVSWAVVALARIFSAKLVEGLGNKSNLASAVMGAVINSDGSESNGQPRYQHRVPDHQQQRTATADSR